MNSISSKVSLSKNSCRQQHTHTAKSLKTVAVTVWFLTFKESHHPITTISAYQLQHCSSPSHHSLVAAEAEAEAEVGLDRGTLDNLKRPHRMSSDSLQWGVILNLGVTIITLCIATVRTSIRASFSTIGMIHANWICLQLHSCSHAHHS
jgi:hypothetical protein